jgi:hypothetical protein
VDDFVAVAWLDRSVVPPGAGQAAAQSGNRDKARHYFSKLLELAGSGDLRPETEKARRYLASS